MTEKSKPKLGTIPMYDIVHGFLGYGYWDKRPIPKHIAEIIFTSLKNESLGYIQFEDEDTLLPLEEPILWDYSFWVVSTEKWKRARAYSDKEREKNEILNHNIKLISPFIGTFLGIEDPEKCKSKAYEILKGNKIKHLRLIGFTGKLVTKYNEIT